MSSRSRRFRCVRPVRHASNAAFGEKPALKFVPGGRCVIMLHVHVIFVLSVAGLRQS